MNPRRRWYVGPFVADAREHRVWRDGVPVPVARKSFALLMAFLERPGQLLTKAELLDKVWAGSVVTEAALSRAVHELRVALGDDAALPRYIETAHGLGFRFVAPVSDVAAAASPMAEGSPSGLFVGRDAELHTLQAALNSAHSGKRQVVFIGGEPGIGKTLLVDSFIARHCTPGEVWAAQGRCIEQYGAREAYLPMLEALERLATQIGADTLRQTLARYAPAWLDQLPWLAQETDPDPLRRAPAGTSARRMLREIAQTLEVLAGMRTIVLWLEDLHWSDYSSLDVVTYLAGRREPARLLVIASFRPGDGSGRAPPVRDLARELCLRGQGAFVPLQRLGVSSVRDYLQARLGAAERGMADELAGFVHRRTGGNALFMAAMIDDLVRRGDLFDSRAGWQLLRPIEELGDRMPDSLRQLVEGQFERLSDDERRLVEAAAVAGTEFSCASVAAALEIELADAEERCARLAEQGHFLQARPPASWPDGTRANSFAFVHALYWQALHDKVPERRRAEWQLRIGLREEEAFGGQASQIATELAVRFEAGRDVGRAIHYLQQAGAGALARCAYQEGIDLLRHALGLVPHQPAGLQPRRELDLLLPLGAALMAARGYASTDVAVTYERALALCRICARPGELERTLRGLWNVALVGADLVRAHQLASELIARAADAHASPSQAFDAYAKLGQTSMHQGDFAAARTQLEHALSLPIPAADPLVRRESPRVAAYLSWVLWYTGYPAQALDCGGRALQLAEQAASPHSSAFAFGFIAWLHIFCDDAASAARLARRQLEMSLEHGLPYWRCWGEFTQGFAACRLGDAESGLLAMDRAIAAFASMGAEVGMAHFLDLQAEACLRVGRFEMARVALGSSLRAVEQHRDAFQSAETLRLWGELELAEADSAPARVAAIGYFERALDRARQHGARSLALRAAMSLARVWMRQGRAGAALEMLAPLNDAFAEGRETGDLLSAQALLDELRARPAR